MKYLKRSIAYALALSLCLLCSTGSATFVFNEQTMAPESILEMATPAMHTSTPAPTEPPKDSIDYDDQAFRGVPWTMTMEEVAAFEGGKTHTRTVTVTGDVALYGLTASKLSYRFTDGVMTERIFEMKVNTRAAFSSLFYSLMLRYGLPFNAADRQGVWQAGALNITIKRGDTLTITYKQLSVP